MTGYLGPYELNTIVTGDALDLFPAVPTVSVDLIIADPPYNINTKSDGMGKINPWADRINSAWWFSAWIRQGRRTLKPTGALWMFTNWRSFAAVQKASDDLGWPIESVLIWDKSWIGPGGTRGLRPSYELVTLWAGEDFAIANRGIPDIKTVQWSSHKPNGHPAEKPEKLIRWLIEISTEPGAIVLDPFMGSGTTAVSCAAACRFYLGFEVNEATAEKARVRAALPVQEALL